MNQEMMNLIRQNDADFLRGVFHEDFQSADKWRQYIQRTYGPGEADVNTILDNRGEWDVADFHALYIACWVFQPVEKGSFMLRLTPQQRANVRDGYDALSARWTSHLHEHGRSAASGWHFLQGYHELLVQMEGGGRNAPGDKLYVFLKAEGHTAFQLAHVKAFMNKLKTGEGMTANPYLHNLAKNNPQMVQARGAENYSKSYERLLKELGLSGKTVTVRQVLTALHTRALERQRTMPGVAVPGPLLNPNIADMPSSQVMNFVNQQLAPFIRQLEPQRSFHAHQQGVLWIYAFNAAVADGSIDGILSQMSRDAALTGEEDTPRYFQEITVNPAQVNDSLRALQNHLNTGA